MWEKGFSELNSWFCSVYGLRYYLGGNFCLLVDLEWDGWLMKECLDNNVWVVVVMVGCLCCWVVRGVWLLVLYDYGLSMVCLVIMGVSILRLY